MKRNILFLFTIAFLFIACSNDDSNPTTEETTEEGVDETPEEETPEEETPDVDCGAAVTDFDAKPSDFEISTTVGEKFIRNNTDQVQAALDTCGEGGVVWLEDKVWIIDRPLVPKFNNTKIVGGTLKRGDAVKSALTQAVQVGDSVLNVENSDAFYPGLILSVAGGDQYEDALFPLVFVATAEDGRITLGSGSAMDFEPGDVVFNTTPLIAILNNTVNGTIISNVTFDGNEENNNETNDWRINTGLALSGKDQIVECSSFINSPGESMIGHNVTVRNTTGENLFGSFFHASALESGTILIENCSTNDTNKAPFGTNGHNEGTITLSNNSGNLTIKDSNFTLGGQSAWGVIAEDDCNIIATNTTFADHPRKYFLDTVPDAPCFDDSDVTYTNVPN
ncbi:hypothetical protein FGM00_05990 [Aggregatimonas sangjinii]|uniref:Right-handed parallel beta-helix repeat-containing protein n=1 Tax=Aggregatimonas sangjinii TaxID=2583587 RepID=A0A5B7SRP1_9FLAO|nr:hypothetical protein [Aggregatimonas sangjinii]QCW99670.1 hypothetical protein FGM00_05990 [Aggregatimonas sangjinii]